MRWVTARSTPLTLAFAASRTARTERRTTSGSDTSPETRRCRPARRARSRQGSPTTNRTTPARSGSMLWEAYNVLVDAHGVTVARRRMSDYVVAGLLMTPAEASFTEGRDAILTAVSALDADDMLLVAAAFAGRGLGSCAVSPAPDSPDNDDLLESGTVSALVVASGVDLVDDRVSCDAD